jgi:hypothetical protein
VEQLAVSASAHLIWNMTELEFEHTMHKRIPSLSQNLI